MIEEAEFNVTDFLPYLLNQAAEQTSLEFQKIYKGRYGMLRSEWRVLFHLGKFGTLTSNDIVAMARIHKTKISRAVSALENKGFVTRNRDDQDRRKENLTLTKHGQKVYEELVLQAAEYEKNLTAELEAADIKFIKDILKVLMHRSR